MIRRLLTAPALHFALAGALLFAFGARRQASVPPGVGAGDRGAITVSASRLAEARGSFELAWRRPPTAEEEALLVRRLVDEEVLLEHALELGLAEQEPVRRRLAQVAAFVGEDPEQALALGLHRDDLVVRRILVDSARRLIRAAVLSREPSEAALAAHLEEHAERFEHPEEVRIAVLPAAAAGGGAAAKELPLLERRDLERRYGHPFAQALDAARVGEAQGPLPSRYGPVRVWVREHRPARPASLAEVRDEVRTALLEELAERWLAARTDELRGRRQLVVADAAMAGGSPTAVAGGAP